MGLVLSVTVVIPEGGESGVFGSIGVGCPVGVPWGEVFVLICALIVAPPAVCGLLAPSYLESVKKDSFRQASSMHSYIILSETVPGENSTVQQTMN